MSDILIRKWDSANAKHIYTDCADCSYDECWDSATKTHGVYCDSTFYPRCWNPSLDPKNWQVTVPCCGETVPGTCCDNGESSMPKYIQVTFSGIVDCGCPDAGNVNGYPICTDLNDTFILEWVSGCIWKYISLHTFTCGTATVNASITITFTMSSNVSLTAIIAGPPVFCTIPGACFYATTTKDKISGSYCHEYTLTNGNSSCDCPPDGINGTALVSYL